MDFTPRANFAAACTLAAMVALGTASAATPSGQITANPEVVIIPSGALSGTTAISWTTVNCANAQETVQSRGGTEILFGDAVSFQGARRHGSVSTRSPSVSMGDRTRTLA